MTDKDSSAEIARLRAALMGARIWIDYFESQCNEPENREKALAVIDAALSVSDVRGTSAPPQRTKHQDCVALFSPTCAYLSDGTKIVPARDKNARGRMWLEHKPQGQIVLQAAADDPAAPTPNLPAWVNVERLARVLDEEYMPWGDSDTDAEERQEHCEMIVACIAGEVLATQPAGEELEKACEHIRALESLLLTVECKRCYGRGEVTVETAVPEGEEPIGSHEEPCTACNGSGRRFRKAIPDDGGVTWPLVSLDAWTRSEAQTIREAFARLPEREALAECKRALDKVLWRVSDMGARNGKLVDLTKKAIRARDWRDLRDALVVLGYASQCKECGGCGYETFGSDHAHVGTDVECEACRGSGLVNPDGTGMLRKATP